MKKTVMLSLMIFSLIVTLTKGEGNFHGKAFGDYYYIAASHNDSIVNNNGFWLRRIYFTYDNILSKNVKIRLRMEMSSAGDFKTTSKLIPAIKDAYILYDKNGTNFKLGIQPTPTFAIVEKSWHYRALEKTPLDMQKWASSRDFAFSVYGKASILYYTLMLGNNSSNATETNKDKKVYSSIAIKPTEAITFEIYGDYKLFSSNKDYTGQAFISYVNYPIRFGLLFARKGDLSNSSSSSQILSLFSVFSVNKTIDFVARYDRAFEANPNGEKISYSPLSDSSALNLIMCGIAITPIKNIQIIPNLEYVLYDNSSVSTDLYPKLTFNYKW